MKQFCPATQSEVFSQLRFPLIVLVVYAHTYSGVEAGYGVLTAGWDAYECLKIVLGQSLVKVAVPVFYVMSGYLFFSNVRQWNVGVYLQKMKRRAWSLLVPYLLWNALLAYKYQVLDWQVFWTFYPSAGAQFDWLGHEQLLTAPLNMPLWFLRDLIVVSLLSPVFHWVLSRVGGWGLLLATVVYLSGVYAFIPGLSAYAVYFFGLGAYFGMRKQNLLDLTLRFERLSYVVSLLLLVTMLLTYGTKPFSSVMLCFRLVGAVAVLNISYRILSATPRRIPAVVSASSYFIYLCHFAFGLLFIDKALIFVLGHSTAASCLHYLLSSPLKVAVYLLVYVLYRRVRNLLKSLAHE